VHLRAVGTGLKGICGAKNFGVEGKIYHPKKNHHSLTLIWSIMNYDSRGWSFGSRVQMHLLSKPLIHALGCEILSELNAAGARKNELYISLVLYRRRALTRDITGVIWIHGTGFVMCT
jgi:hypothetical protein